MAIYVICDFCDKKMNFQERLNVSVIQHDEDDRQVANVDLCPRCLSGLARHIEQMKTTRGAD